MLLELSLYARKLKNVAGTFKGTSDPFCVVTKMPSDSTQQPTGENEKTTDSELSRFSNNFECLLVSSVDYGPILI